MWKKAEWLAKFPSGLFTNQITLLRNNYVLWYEYRLGDDSFICKNYAPKGPIVYILKINYGILTYVTE